MQCSVVVVLHGSNNMFHSWFAMLVIA